ncbi:MAG: hypothetical protein FWE21_00390 [Defluviitaleaceae bacterium]|nr:hypothetical protein [Defluviitaleaceae bacterium]
MSRKRINTKSIKEIQADVGNKDWDKDLDARLQAREKIDASNGRIFVRRAIRFSAVFFGVTAFIVVFGVFPMADMEIPGEAGLWDVVILYSYALRSLVQPATIALATIVVTTLLGRVYDRFVERDKK